MRITNNMIMDRASSNINGNKVNVDATNTQMTTQKKIDRPSEDPVIAIRSLRLQTSLNKINQYYEKNIPDAESWMEVTETALLNIKDIVTDMRTLCVQGATGTLTPSDRNTILNQLKALQDQVYKEGNADYAGRSVFTGFRTDQNLTFMNDEAKTTYTITEPLEAINMDKHRYYTNEVDMPVDESGILALDATGGVDSSTQNIQESDYYRLRLSYDNITLYNGTDYPGAQGEKLNLSFSTSKTVSGITTKTETQIPLNGETNATQIVTPRNAKGEIVDPPGVQETSAASAYSYRTFKTEEDWEKWSKDEGKEKKYVDDNEVVLIEETGELIFGDTIATDLMTGHMDMSITYEKKGFTDGELRPEYYFDCIRTMDESGNDLKPLNDGVGIKHDKFNEKGEAISYSIDYTVAQNQTLGVNLEAYDVFDHNIYQDMGDMVDAVERAITANDKVTKIKSMMEEDQYQDPKVQEKLEAWLELANKEMDFYNDNLGKLCSTILGSTDQYLTDITHSITKLGCKVDQLKMTEKRMSEQQESVEELKSKNDNLDLSEIILNYTAAYTAYQSSLTAAGRLGQQTLLNYI